MGGYLHLFRIGTAEAAHQRKTAEYQVNYTTGGKTFTRVLDEHAVVEFLTQHAALGTDTTTEALEELQRTGQVTVGDVEIAETRMPALGLQQITSDY